MQFACKLCGSKISVETMNKVKGVCPYCKQRTSFVSSPEAFGFEDEDDDNDFKSFMMQEMLREQVGYTDFDPDEHPEEQMKNIVNYWNPITFCFKKYHFDEKDMFSETGTKYRLPFESVFLDFDEYFNINLPNEEGYIVFKNFAMSEEDEGNLIWLYFPFTYLEEGHVEGIQLNKLLAIEKEPDSNETITKSTVWYGDGTNEFQITGGKLKIQKHTVKKIKCFCENMIRFLNDNSKDIVYVNRFPRRLRGTFGDKKLNKECGYIPIKEKLQIKPFFERIKNDKKNYSKTINQRMGHYVTYRSERYVNMKGRTVWRKGFVKNPEEKKDYKKT